jgi:citrate lyase subunit beta/citryl-CoA lyase
MTDPIATATTFLFVPGNRPERFARALDSGADCVIVDLEDAVVEADKQSALEHTITLLRQTRSATTLVVRINDPRTEFGSSDIAALVGLGDSALRAVMVPKAEANSGLATLAAHLPAGVGVIPLVESATGLHEVDELAGTRGVVRLAFGPLDLCAEFGLDPDDSVRLSPARFALIAASRRAGLPAPVDGPATEVSDLAFVGAAAVESLRSGFTAKLCIHPAQIAATAAALSPIKADIAWARKLLESTADGVALVDGRMVDRPVLLRARHILASVAPTSTAVVSLSPEES